MSSGMDEDNIIRWAVRLDAGLLEPEEQDELDAWLGEDPRREGALLRAQATLAYLDRARVFGAGGQHDIGMEEEGPPLPFSRRRFLAGGTAAGLVAAGLGAGFLLLNPSQSIETTIGEIRRVPLADGSAASLNTSTRIAATIDENSRSIRLYEGEAWFQVAPDRSRPFVVEVGDVRVRAVGTAFSVRRRDDGVEVLVTEGVIETWIDGHNARPTRVPAGTRGFIRASAAKIETVEAPEAVDRALAWRVGEIALNGETLEYAVGEINRYNRHKIVIEDAALAREPLVGYFRADEPENFGRAVASMIDARLVTEGENLRIVRNR